MDLRKKQSLNDEEKEAILAAIGALDSVNLAENRVKGIIKAKKARRNKNLEF